MGGGTGNGGYSGGGGQQPLNLTNYKTVNCKYFELGTQEYLNLEDHLMSLGMCRYGNDCAFVHWPEEQRTPDQNQ